MPSFLLPTWQESFPLSLGHCHWCWWQQWWPWQGRTSHVFLVKRYKKQECSQATTPLALLLKKVLSSAALLSDVCLPPVGLKLATSVPLVVFLTPTKYHVQFKSIQLHQWAIHPSSLAPAKPRLPKMAYSFCAAFKDRRGVNGVYNTWWHIKQNI